MRVVVVGAGLAGLSAACHLAGRGHDVTVCEAAAEVGGKAGSWRSGGYRLDTGPTVITMVDVIDEVFEAAGADREALLTLERLDPAYRATYRDGSEIMVRADPAAMAQEVRETCGPEEAAAFERFSERLAEMYALERGAFIDRSYDSPSDLLGDVASLVRLLRLGGFRRLDSLVSSTFSDDRLRRLFSFQSLYAGLSPFQALGLYAVISYMDLVAGVWAAEGGAHALASALSEAAQGAGAEVRTGTTATSITKAPSGRLDGVRVASGEVISVDAAVITAEVVDAYPGLLGEEAPTVARRGVYSPSCVLWLAGVSGELPPRAAHHNIHFGGQWRGAFEDLLGHGRLMADPSVLVSVPSRSDPTAAPRGGHAIYALEPVPNLDADVDWDDRSDEVRERLVSRVRSEGYPTAVEVERFVDPLGWAAAGCPKGTPFSLSHRFFQTGPFRPGNVVRSCPGAFLAGASTVPGVGVPMVLMSGGLAADRVEAYGAPLR